MKYTSFVPGIILVVFWVCLAEAAPQKFTKDSAHDIDTLVSDLPLELRQLYHVIVSPTTDEIRKENYIWRVLELLRLKKYKAYLWFYDWLVNYQNGYGRYGPGRYTPRHGGPGGRTPGHGGPGGRTPGHGGPGGRTPGHGGPGGRTPGHGGPGRRTKHRDGPGGRTRGHHGRHH